DAVRLDGVHDSPCQSWLTPSLLPNALRTIGQQRLVGEGHRVVLEGEPPTRIAVQSRWREGHLCSFPCVSRALAVLFLNHRPPDSDRGSRLGGSAHSAYESSCPSRTSQS